MRGWLGLLAFVTACGGASQTDLFNDGSSGSGTGQTGPTWTETPPAATTTPPTPTPTTTPPPASTKPCATITYYKDTDDDGFGGTVTQAACTSPGKNWVTQGGDCDDNNADVFPGQTAFFHESYTKVGGLKSFDYDCNKVEVQQAPARKTAGVCTVVGNACTGEGFVPAQRVGVGIEPICGATQYQTCTFKNGGQLGGSCETKVVNAEAPVSCH